MKNTVIVLSIITLMLGCSSTEKMSSNDKELAYINYITSESLTAKKRVNSFKLSSWKSLTDKYLVITSLKDEYLVEVSPCLHLENSMAIKLQLFSPLVLTTSDNLFVVDTPDDSNYKCQIRSIYPISKEQSNLLVNIGNAKVV